MNEPKDLSDAEQPIAFGYLLGLLDIYPPTYLMKNVDSGRYCWILMIPVGGANIVQRRVWADDVIEAVTALMPKAAGVDPLMDLKAKTWLERVTALITDEGHSEETT